MISAGLFWNRSGTRPLVTAETIFCRSGVSEVVETQREEYTETALLTVRCYNNVEKKRSIYGVPYTVGASMNHIWRPLVEKAGYQMSDIPKTWDAFYDFFKEVQKKLRAQGMRNVYGLG